jgi:hypothetical protein
LQRLSTLPPERELGSQNSSTMMKDLDEFEDFPAQTTEAADELPLWEDNWEDDDDFIDLAIQLKCSI